MNSISIRRADISEYPQLVEILVRAFDQDYFFNWLLRQDQHRIPAYETFFQKLLYHLTLPYGLVFTDSQIRSVSIWQPPGGGQLTMKTLIRMIPGFITVTGFKGVILKIRGVGFMGSKRPQFPNYYLQNLAVDPKFQRNGLGGQHLQFMLNICDQLQIPTHLETANKDNVALYEKYGYQIFEETNIATHGPYMWFMGRAVSENSHMASVGRKSASE